MCWVFLWFLTFLPVRNFISSPKRTKISTISTAKIVSQQNDHIFVFKTQKMYQTPTLHASLYLILFVQYEVNNNYSIYRMLLILCYGRRK